MRVLVTGCAGFIGFHTARALIARGDAVVGFDNLNDYYSVALKESRLAILRELPGFEFHRADLADRIALGAALKGCDTVVHLAAQAGIRYSLENPAAYVESNLVGFANLLEGVRQHRVRHLVYASSSSVYGGNTKMPFSETDPVDGPVSLYAATKKSNELMAHVYSHLYSQPTTGLRFFTVYGPWSRPDMAPILFTRAILAGEPIKVFNEGRMKRDFTYVDDIVEGVLAVLDRPPTSQPPYAIYNIGASEPVELLRFIELLEQSLGKTATKIMMPIQPGEVVATFADTSALEKATGFCPTTPLEVGVPRFVDWYGSYYRT